MPAIAIQKFNLGTPSDPTIPNRYKGRTSTRQLPRQDLDSKPTYTSRFFRQECASGNGTKAPFFLSVFYLLAVKYTYERVLLLLWLYRSSFVALTA
jgi:hypothetical protein